MYHFMPRRGINTGSCNRSLTVIATPSLPMRGASLILTRNKFSSAVFSLLSSQKLIFLHYFLSINHQVASRYIYLFSDVHLVLLLYFLIVVYTSILVTANIKTSHSVREVEFLSWWLSEVVSTCNSRKRCYQISSSCLH